MATLGGCPVTRELCFDTHLIRCTKEEEEGQQQKEEGEEKK